MSQRYMSSNLKDLFLFQSHGNCISAGTCVHQTDKYDGQSKRHQGKCFVADTEVAVAIQTKYDGHDHTG